MTRFVALLLLLALPARAQWSVLPVPDREAASRFLNQVYLELLPKSLPTVASRAASEYLAKERLRTQHNLAHARSGKLPSAAWQAGARKFLKDYVDEYFGLGASTPMARWVAEAALGSECGWDLPDWTVAITFDDGPEQPATSKVLAALRQRRVPAAFFLVGEQLRDVREDEGAKRPDYTGFTLGTHTWSHALLVGMEPKKIRTELALTKIEFARWKLPPARYLRAPFGACTSAELSLIRSLGLRPVLAAIDSDDTDTERQKHPSLITNRVLALVLLHRRGIIAFHDPESTTPQVVPAVLDGLRSLGVKFAAIP